MLLQTDDQTIDDLRLFSRREQPGIYDIYNNTSTRGGESVLEHMFRNPLASPKGIQQRASIIAALASENVVFPFPAVQLDNVEKYISHAAGHRNGQPGTLGEKEIGLGVESTIELLHGLRNFIQQQVIVDIEAYAEERQTIHDLLNDVALQPVFNQKPRTRLSYAAITAFDILFREKERSKIFAILQRLYHIDVYISVAQIANRNKFVFPIPHISSERFIRVKGVFYPDLKNAVANDLSMDGNHSVIFLTGANMAGKSTFLRSLSVAVYIAHMGFPVAAASMEFSVLDGLYTTINLPDNLGIGASHFYAEVLRVRKIATELGAGKSIFVVFDELFRGTNVKDAHEGTVEITQAFSRKNKSLFIISSHIVEAADELKKRSNIDFYYLPTRMNGTTPEYTYRLQPGVTDDRHGMIIIRNEGVLDILAQGNKSA